MPRKRHPLRALIVLAAVAASVAFALTASNTFGTSSAGAGSGTIRGYDVSAIRYTAVPADPARLRRVRFRLSVPGARLARVRLTPAGAWFTCGLSGGGRNANCDLRGLVRVSDVVRLDVVAVR